MSLRPMWKKCKRCGKMYDWNPDVGVMSCPYCFEKKKKVGGIIGKILGGSNRHNPNILPGDDDSDDNFVKN